ncbi:MAG TPA: deoxyribodipyrimidine photolyase, partial [Gammaproteobacteria bacterium]|nr:deoxyribodipyrimidine photolyase [Gammaproteobacteria bacterium]
GTDAAPYFRIFNPIRQAERFDPNGDFVRSMVPELSGVEKKRVLEPWRGPAIEGYPEAMIDLSVGRDATLAAWSV